MAVQFFFLGSRFLSRTATACRPVKNRSDRNTCTSSKQLDGARPVTLHYTICDKSGLRILNLPKECSLLIVGRYTEYISRSKNVSRCHFNLCCCHTDRQRHVEYTVCDITRRAPPPLPSTHSHTHTSCTLW